MVHLSQNLALVSLHALHGEKQVCVRQLVFEVFVFVADSQERKGEIVLGFDQLSFELALLHKRFDVLIAVEFDAVLYGWWLVKLVCRIKAALPC